MGISTRRALAVAATSLAATVAVAATSAPTQAAPSSSGDRGPRQASAPVEVQLLSITDFHGYIRPHDDTSNGTVPGPDGPIVVGGAPYIATHFDRLSAGHKNSIRFAVGDSFSGWPTEVAYHADEPTVEFLNYLGIEFTTVGNHELDISPSFLIDHMWKGRCFGTVDVDSCFTDSSGRRFRGSNYPYATANIVDKKNGKPIVPPYVIKHVVADNGRRIPIGFINLTTDTTVEGSTSFQPTLEDLPLVETANKYAKILKRRGVEAIIVTAHEGLTAGGQFWTCNDAPSGPMADFARQADPAIDAIITGHWHTQFICHLPDPAGNLRPVVEAGYHGKLINEMILSIDPRTKDVIRSETKVINHPVTRDVPPDPVVQAMVDYWLDRRDETGARPVAEITGDLTRDLDATGQSTLGNLVADALYEDSQRTAPRREQAADLALVVLRAHSGSNSLRGDLRYAPGTNPADAPGRVLFEEAWAAFGYANPVVTVTVTGQQIHDALEDQWRTEPDGTVRFAPFGVSSNVRYAFDADGPVGDRVDPADVTIDGEPLDLTKEYRLATLAYTLIGGDGTTAFQDSYADPVRGTRDYEVLRGYLTRHSPVEPPALDRVTVK
jgi:2',3'-cyclic-nucleotide 2'-phosphodiesterase (5'-nucleotidase family)